MQRILNREYTQKILPRWLIAVGFGLAALGIALKRTGVVCERFEIFLYSLSVLFILFFITRFKNKGDLEMAVDAKMVSIIRYVMLTCWSVGYLALALRGLFREHLSDFTRGFLDGFALVLIGVGFVYLIWCLAKGENPYVIRKK